VLRVLVVLTVRVVLECWASAVPSTAARTFSTSTLSTLSTFSIFSIFSTTPKHHPPPTCTFCSFRSPSAMLSGIDVESSCWRIAGSSH